MILHTSNIYTTEIILILIKFILYFKLKFSIFHYFILYFLNFLDFDKFPVRNFYFLNEYYGTIFYIIKAYMYCVKYTYT